MMALKTGTLFAELKLDQTHYQKGLSSAKTDFKALGTNLMQSAAGMGPAGGALSGLSGSFAAVGGTAAVAATAIAAVAAAAVAVGAAAFKAASDLGGMAEKLSNMSETTGLSAKTLQELKFVAENAGLSFDAMANASSMVQRKLMGVEEDSGMAAKTFERLGISTKDSFGQLKSMDILFPELIRKFQSMSNTTERNMLASQIFGRSLNDVAPLLGMTAAEMDKATKRAHELGLVMSDKDLLNAQQLDDSIDDIRQQFKGMWMSFATSMLPVVKPAVEWLQRTLQDVWPKIRKGTAGFWSSVKPVFVELGKILKIVWDLLKPLFSGLLAAKTAAWKTLMQALALVLKGIAWVLEKIRMAIEAVIAKIKEYVAAMAQVFGITAALAKEEDKRHTLISTLVDAATAGLIKHALALQEQKRLMAETAAAEVTAVMDILKKQKELRAEENARKRDLIGWGSISDVWKTSMADSMKMQFPVEGPNAKELTRSDVPSARELQEIVKEMRKNNEKQDALRKIVSDRLGVYV